MRFKRWSCAPLVLIFALWAAPASARVVSATGEKFSGGRMLHVEVLVVVPPGANEAKARAAALREQGARSRKPRPPGGGGSAGYAFNGLKWDLLPVVQSYNPAGQPVAAQSALTDTHATWGSVSGSDYRMSFGGQTSRCPSLVRECPGAQTLDSANDVAWLTLGRSTLGVTWYTTSTDEADMAMNTRFSWSSTCGNVSGRYDVESVFLHENGHVAGLDHVNDTNQVMNPSYAGAKCALGPGDAAGIAALY